MDDVGYCGMRLRVQPRAPSAGITRPSTPQGSTTLAKGARHCTLGKDYAPQHLTLQPQPTPKTHFSAPSTADTPANDLPTQPNPHRGCNTIHTVTKYLAPSQHLQP